MPPTLGQRLKHAREKRGLSLRDIEHSTKIPVARLQDLEDDKLNTFGGMTYAKSFLRTYSGLLEVNADHVLSQMQPPPLGGVRDYRYLMESHGPWVTEKSERHVVRNAPPALTEGKSFAFAAMVVIAFGLLIGGGVLASAYFNSKPAAKTSAATPATDSTGTLNKGDSFTEEQEFSLFGVSLTIIPDKAAPVTPPKAQPIIEPSTPAPTPPKAVPVR